MHPLSKMRSGMPDEGSVRRNQKSETLTLHLFADFAIIVHVDFRVNAFWHGQLSGVRKERVRFWVRNFE